MSLQLSVQHLALTQASGLVPQNRFKDTQEGFRELVVEIVFRVNWDIVFEDVERVLRLFVSGSAY
jgi:hypothetical protein